MYRGCYEEGDKCPEKGCNGVLDWYDDPDLSCSCHIYPPCSKCTDSRLYCNECGGEVDGNGEVVESDAKNNHTVGTSIKVRELDSTKIDYNSKPHTHFSMIKEGVYPDGVTRQDVYDKVVGTFGGRFESFGCGRFKFIAYTD